MEILSDGVLLKQLDWRYATKHFDPTRLISDADWKTLSEVLRLAPSSYGLQPWKFILVKNKEVRKELRAVSWDQPQIEECSHLLVITTLKSISASYVGNYVSRISEVRNVPRETLEQYEGMMVSDVVEGPRSKIINFWAQRQSYIAMGFLLQAAALKGIDACPMEGLDTAAYDKILGLEDTDYSTVAVVALGYRAKDDVYQNLAKVRFSESDIMRTID